MNYLLQKGLDFIENKKMSENQLRKVGLHQLSGCRFESRFCPLNFRYCDCFKQGVP